jgi:hypothetical protein
MVQAISSLAVGSKVKFGTYKVEGSTTEPIIWQIAAKNHEGYPVNSVTLLTEKIIDLRGFDAKEPANSNSDRQKYGNNRYLHSNIRQWLNKGGHPWWVATHPADITPNDSDMNQPTGYDDEYGFLSNFTIAELAAILDTSLIVARNTVTDGGGSETMIDKVFLLSNTEVGLANENNIVEGNLLPLFSDDASRKAYMTQQAFGNTYSTSKPSTVNDAWYWWLRTPLAGYANRVRFVNSSGSLYYNSAYLGNYGVRPALNLASDILVSDTTDADGCYNFRYSLRITLDKAISAPVGAKLEKIKFKPKVNSADMQVKITDAEKIVYTAGANSDTVDLEIAGKDGIIDKIAYTVG